MRIRKAIMKDKEGLAKLYLQFWEAHPNIDPLISIKKKPTLKNQIKAAAKDIKKKDEHYLIADDHGRVAGFIELHIKKNHKMFKVSRFGYINSLVVDKKYRKKGIARLLLKEGLKFFKARKMKYVRTNIYFSNKAAIKVWPKMGFRKESMFMLKKI